MKNRKRWRKKRRKIKETVGVKGRRKHLRIEEKYVRRVKERRRIPKSRKRKSEKKREWESGRRIVKEKTKV